MKYSIFAGAVRWSGGTMILERGQSIEDDHPFAKERPDLFDGNLPGAQIPQPKQRERREPRVERATRAPGEQRGPARGGRGKAGDKSGE